MKKAAVSIFLAFALLSSPTTPAFGQKQKTAVVTRSERYYRTELYFGQSIPGGGRVTEDDWEDFLLNEVTPRFREGFTVLDARGQWMQEDDEVIKEPTKLVLLFYRA